MVQNGRIKNFGQSLGPRWLNQIIVGRDRPHVQRTFNGMSHEIRYTDPLKVFCKRLNNLKDPGKFTILFKLQFMIQLNMKTTCLFLTNQLIQDNPPPGGDLLCFKL